MNAISFNFFTVDLSTRIEPKRALSTHVGENKEAVGGDLAVESAVEVCFRNKIARRRHDLETSAKMALSSALHADANAMGARRREQRAACLRVRVAHYALECLIATNMAAFAAAYASGRRTGENKRLVVGLGVFSRQRRHGE